MEESQDVPCSEDFIRDCLLKKAEELFASGRAAESIHVSWDPVRCEAVEAQKQVVQENATRFSPINKFVLSVEEWASPRPTTHFVPNRVPPNNPFFLSGMPIFERIGLVSGADDTAPLVGEHLVIGRVVLYLMTSVLRTFDNRALQYAHRVAREGNLALLVVAFAGSGQKEAQVRLECLADVASGLTALQIPLVVFSGSLCTSVVAAFVEECLVHIVVTDWGPGEDEHLAQLRAAAGHCPLLSFDSSYWTLRHPDVAVDMVREICGDVMGQMMAPLPKLAPLAKNVQDMLLASTGQDLFIPSQIVRPRANLPPGPWKHGSMAARESVTKCMLHLKNCSPSAMIATELREQIGPWRLVAHIESGAISASECLRCIPESMENSQKRWILQMLVAGREQRLLWWQFQLKQALHPPKELLSPSDLCMEAPGKDEFCHTIHRCLMKTGLIHPLLLGYWLDGLPSPRIASATRLLGHFGAFGCNFSVMANLLFELSLGEPRPLEQPYKTNISRVLGEVLRQS